MCLRTHARRCVRDERPMDERASRQVSAPAGSGKTFLLRSWIGAAGLAEGIAWVSVQREERNPQRFWVSVLSALRQTAAGSTVVRPLTAAPDLDGWAVVERLLWACTSCGWWRRPARLKTSPRRTRNNTATGRACHDCWHEEGTGSRTGLPCRQPAGRGGHRRPSDVLDHLRWPRTRVGRAPVAIPGGKATCHPGWHRRYR